LEGDCPALALVLDDCGGSLELARRVISLDLPMTWAIIPNIKYSVATAELLRGHGVPFLVHVPMQAEGDPDGEAGSGGRYHVGVGMGRGDVRDAMVPLLDSLEGAYGVNNHRGSKATADAELMGHVMELLAEREMFFMDSRTSPKSVAYDVAVAKGLGAAKNSHFLDNASDRGKIFQTTMAAMEGARKKGSAVAICHLRPETVACLERLALDVEDGMHKSGVMLITLPQLADSAKGD
jgi:polysaccharide deacetylase 2 family uncharacterized protein YibQ